MKQQYKCDQCQQIFEAEGNKLEYTSVVYGPCWKYISDCPDCGCQCDEHREPNPARKASHSKPISSPSCCCNGGSCGL